MTDDMKFFLMLPWTCTGILWICFWMWLDLVGVI